MWINQLWQISLFVKPTFAQDINCFGDHTENTGCDGPRISLRGRQSEGQIFSKNAWKWRKLDKEGGVQNFTM